MRSIFHLTQFDIWRQAQATGQLHAASLASEGFIHFSRPHQLLKTADKHFKGVDEFCLLHINQDLCVGEMKYEGVDPKNRFPHLYAPLNVSAVLGAYACRKEAGVFVFPDEFRMVGDTLIRAGSAGDEAELASVHGHSWQESYPGLVPDEVLRERPLFFRQRLQWWKSVLATDVNDGIKAGHRQPVKESVFVAESARHGVVGFCVVGPARDSEFENQGEILAIYCLQAYKGLGLGAALVRAGLSSLRAQGFAKAYLWVLKENHPAREFYRRMKGVETGQEKIVTLGKDLVEIRVEFPTGIAMDEASHSEGAFG